MAIPKKRPGDVIKADEFNELAGRTPPEISAPAAIRDGDTVTLRTTRTSSYDFEVVAEEDLGPFSVFGISGATAETSLPRPRPTVRGITAAENASPLVLLTNGQTEIRKDDKGPAYVIGKEPVLLRVNVSASVSSSQTAGIVNGETVVRGMSGGPLMAISNAFYGPGHVWSAWFIRAADSALIGMVQQGGIPGRDGLTLGSGSVIVHYRTAAGELIQATAPATASPWWATVYNVGTEAIDEGEAVILNPAAGGGYYVDKPKGGDGGGFQYCRFELLGEMGQFGASARFLPLGWAGDGSGSWEEGDLLDPVGVVIGLPAGSTGYAIKAPSGEYFWTNANCPPEVEYL